MTKENVPSRQIIPMPFAGGEGADLANIKQTTDPIEINFSDGFPPAYSSPKENNGKFVTRAQINAIGNLASRNEFVRMCGGLNTFDPAFSEAIGGYPMYAILDYYSNGKFFKVISIVDNNTHNFVNNGVDGSHWAYLNADTPVPDINNGYVDISFGKIDKTFGINTTAAYMIGAFQAKYSGMLIPAPDCVTPVPGPASTFVDGGSIIYGASFFLKDIGTSGNIDDSFTYPQASPSGWTLNGFTQLNPPFGNSGIATFTPSGQTYIPPTVSAREDTTVTQLLSVTSGHFYALLVSGGVFSWNTNTGSATVNYSSLVLNGELRFRIIL